MDVVTQFTLLILGMVMVYIYKRMRSAVDSVKGVSLPGPRPLPFLGNTFDVDTGNIHISFAYMAIRYGAIFQVNILGQISVVLNDFQLIRKAFASESYSDIFNDRPDSAFAKYLLYDSSDIAFESQGERQRRCAKCF